MKRNKDSEPDNKTEAQAKKNKISKVNVENLYSKIKNLMTTLAEIKRIKESSVKSDTLSDKILEEIPVDFQEGRNIVFPKEVQSSPEGPGSRRPTLWRFPNPQNKVNKVRTQNTLPCIEIDPMSRRMVGHQHKTTYHKEKEKEVVAIRYEEGVRLSRISSTDDQIPSTDGPKAEVPDSDPDSDPDSR